MRGKKNLDPQVDLIAFISLLAVLICSLLLTSIWINVTTINVKQSVGAASKTQKNKKKEPAAWVRIYPRGNLNIHLENASRLPKRLRRVRLAPHKGSIPTSEMAVFFKNLKTYAPSLKMVFFKVEASASYELLIQAMDVVKGEGYSELAVVPL